MEGDLASGRRLSGPPARCEGVPRDGGNEDRTHPLTACIQCQSGAVFALMWINARAHAALIRRNGEYWRLWCHSGLGQREEQHQEGEDSLRREVVIVDPIPGATILHR